MEVGSVGDVAGAPGIFRRCQSADLPGATPGFAVVAEGRTQRTREATDMDDREKIQVERATRATAHDSRRSTTRCQAINWYLGAFSNVDVYADRVPAAEPAEPAEPAVARRNSR